MANNIELINLGFVNAFLLKAGDGFVLVDTGMSSQYQQLEAALTAAGALPGRIKLVVITHGDMDHAGNGLVLQKKHGCKIAMHQGDAEMVEKGFRPLRRVRTFKARLMLLLFKLRGLFSNKPAFPAFQPDLLLSDGESLSPFGLDAKALHLPGHTSGSLGILTADGDLIASDIFVNQKAPDTAIYIQNDAQLAVTLNKLRKLPLRTIYPGHGRPFDAKEWL